MKVLNSRLRNIPFMFSSGYILKAAARNVPGAAGRIMHETPAPRSREGAFGAAFSRR
jgi:hypothetical protein